MLLSLCYYVIIISFNSDNNSDLLFSPPVRTFNQAMLSISNSLLSAKKHSIIQPAHTHTHTRAHSRIEKTAEMRSIRLICVAKSVCASIHILVAPTAPTPVLSAKNPVYRSSIARGHNENVSTLEGGLL